MFSTCPFVSPISIPPAFFTSASLPRFLAPGKTTVRLRGGGGTRWPPTSQNCQTWCPHAVHWHENQTNSPSWEWQFPIWSLWEEVAIPMQMVHTNHPFSLIRYEQWKEVKVWKKLQMLKYTVFAPSCHCLQFFRLNSTMGKAWGKFRLGNKYLPDTDKCVPIWKQSCHRYRF